MLDHRTFAAALEGREEQLRDEVGADALVCVAPELSNVFVVQTGEDGRQTGVLGNAGQVANIRFPRMFHVRQVTTDGDQFVLTDDKGRIAQGTPAQFTAWLTLLDEDVNPDYEDQLEAILLNTHLLPGSRDPVLDCPRTDLALAGPELAEILQAGEAIVTIGDGEVWLSFDNAWPDKIEELLPHTRALLADVETLGRMGADFLWNQGEEADDTEANAAEANAAEAAADDEDKADEGDGEDPSEEAGEDEFFEGMAPTSLVVYLTGDFAVHYEGMSGTVFYMDGYWPAVHFRADRTPVDYSIEA